MRTKKQSGLSELSDGVSFMAAHYRKQENWSLGAGVYSSGVRTPYTRALAHLGAVHGLRRALVESSRAQANMIAMREAMKPPETSG